MFRLEGVIIRLFVESYRRYIKYSAHFGITKCALYLMYLQYVPTNSLMMSPSSRNMSLDA